MKKRTWLIALGVVACLSGLLYFAADFATLPEPDWDQNPNKKEGIPH